ISSFHFKYWSLLYNNMGSVLAENAFNTMFLSNTPHIVTLYILNRILSLVLKALEIKFIELSRAYRLFKWGFSSM
ncbi:MAG: hypothetical protein L6405_04885, partial [Actinomycetia bacterium]|nr:hypothetical protein [Actinomycetes bacterium]